MIHSVHIFSANTFAAKSIIAVGILRVPQLVRGAFAKSFGKKVTLLVCAPDMLNHYITSIGFVPDILPIFSVHKVI